MTKKELIKEILDEISLRKKSSRNYMEESAVISASVIAISNLYVALSNLIKE